MTSKKNRFLPISIYSILKKSRKVLIVENNEHLIDLLEIHLLDLSCEVIKALNGPRGLELAQRSKYDLIILDNSLPEISGAEICSRLRAKNISTPILMINTEPKRYEKVQNFKCKADAYLVKPFRIGDFINQIKNLLDRLKLLPHSVN